MDIHVHMHVSKYNHAPFPICGSGKNDLEGGARRLAANRYTDYGKALSQLLLHWKEVMIRRKVAERLAARRRISESSEENETTSTNLDSGVRSIGEEVMESGSDEPLDDLEEFEEEEPKKKPWREMDKQVYEEQLEKLQDQLISTMLEKQTLQG